MKTATQDTPDARPTRAVIEQRLLLHNVAWEQYEALGEALRDRAGLRLTYDRGNLEMHTTSAPSAPADWTSDVQRLVLHFVDWQQYEAVSQALDTNHLRTTYDNGSLELMTLSPEHECFKSVLHLIIQVLAEVMLLPLKNLGSTTYRRQDLERGLEPDECFYIKNWPCIRGKARLDLRVDPPPDLAIEIDITHSSLDRLKIYASFRVPEIWRFDGENLRVYRLTANGTYEECERSPTFPGVDLADLARWTREGVNQDDVTLARDFRAWAVDRLGKK